MNSNCIVSKTDSLLPLIMAVIFAILTPGCEEPAYVIHSRSIKVVAPEYKIGEPQQNEIFIIDPAGTRITLLDGTVELYFLKGAVLSPTEFSISSFPISDLDVEGHNLQKWGMLLESTSMENTFNNLIRIWLKYDPDQFQTGALQNHNALTIYSIDPNISSETRIESIGYCSGEPFYDIIKGYINSCGYYVVGEQ